MIIVTSNSVAINDVYSSTTVENIADIEDVLLTSLTNGDVLIYNSSSEIWENGANVPGPHDHDDDYAALVHSHAASDITSGTFDDTRIAESSITQHEAALSITESQIVDLGSYLTDISAESIKDLSDVYSSMTPSDGQVLTYDTTNGWQAETPAGGATGYLYTSSPSTAPSGSGNNSVLIGSGTSTSTANNAVAIGLNAYATVSNNIAIGPEASSTGTRTISITSGGASSSSGTGTGTGHIMIQSAPLSEGPSSIPNGVNKCIVIGNGAVPDHSGQIIMSTGNNTGGAGKLQVSEYVMIGETVGNTTCVLGIPTDISSSTPTNKPILPSSSTCFYEVRVIARSATNGTWAQWHNLRFTAYRDAGGEAIANSAGTGAASTYSGGGGIQTADLTLAWNSTDHCPTITMTGVTAHTIKYLAHVRALKVQL